MNDPNQDVDLKTLQDAVGILKKQQESYRGFAAAMGYLIEIGEREIRRQQLEQSKAPKDQEIGRTLSW